MLVEQIENTWNRLPWRKLEVSVFKLQERIYQAAKTGNFKRMRKLQRMLLHKKGAKLLAVRKVTQDNRGKKTAGIDGVAKLTPNQRMALAESMDIRDASKPVRRVWIPKPGKKEKRPLGIPVMADRAIQALVHMVLEPEWEAKFEPNSYGFRPGRSCWDAQEAIFSALKQKTAYVLDADIEGCFNEIDHQALLKKLNVTPILRRTIKGWLKAKIMDGELFHKPEKGTPQGGIISPLLANVALHGMEQDTKAALAKDLFQYMKQKRGVAGTQQALRNLTVVRYADDFCVIHESLEIVKKAQTYIESWLQGIGLKLHPEKTRTVHTLNKEGNNPPGFDFLGWTIRHFQCKSKKKGHTLLIKPSRASQQRHYKAIRTTLRRMRAATKVEVIDALNPIIKGWAKYHSTSVASRVNSQLDAVTWRAIWRWATRRHSKKSKTWVKAEYFRTIGNRNWQFAANEKKVLAKHSDQKITRFAKVKGTASPYNGEWVYWTSRLGKRPGIPTRVATLLKLQQGKCDKCKLWITDKARMEVHHKDHVHSNNKLSNLALIHGHCHDEVHAKQCA